MRDNQVNRNSNNQNDDGDNVNASLDKIEGKNAVFEALRSGREINKLWVLILPKVLIWILLWQQSFLLLMIEK